MEAAVVSTSRYFVSRDGSVWKVTKETHVLGRYGTKQHAADAARAMARADLPSHVLIQGFDGRYQLEWSYEPLPPRG